MCGVIGYVGEKPCVDFIYSGLTKLEYRGYDSTGIAVKKGNTISVVKSQGKLDRLRDFLPSLPATASIGMGHTRWATHGAPTNENAHPHYDRGVAVIHNGILENYKEFKIQLLEEGIRFSSDTDSEVFVHMLTRELKKEKRVQQALLNLVHQLKGAYAFGVLTQEDPNALYVVKNGSAMVIGLGENENYFASDAGGLIEHTSRFIFLEDGEIARITKDSVDIYDFTGCPVQRDPVTLDWSKLQAGKQGYQHFMLKEIYEQPVVISNTVKRYLGTNNQANQLLDTLGVKAIDFRRINKIQLTACGTAYLAGMVAANFLESMLKLPVRADLASELRYRDPCIDENTLVIAITQSGETLDTLASVKMARKMGAQILSICNVPFSSIAREAHSTIYMEAGPEIGVASTKAFTAMVLNLYFLTLGIASVREKLSDEAFQVHANNLRKLPPLIDQALTKEKQISTVAESYFEATNCLFVGRGCHFPIALEGALKLKEISYIHAEGYAGGELKHGPIALIDRNMPVVAIVPKDKHREKMLSNVEEIKAREGRILGVGAKDDDVFRTLCVDYLECPQIDDEVLQTILSAIPLQLFAYNIAVLRGTDVDQPRNLAKSVTVE